MTANKMMPTHGKRPEGLKDDAYVWIQVDGDDDIYCGRVRDVYWDTKTAAGHHVVTYCPAETPAPYVPEPDYSKWIGKVCKFWDEEGEEPHFDTLLACFAGSPYPFQARCEFSWVNCRPVTADEIVKE